MTYYLPAETIDKTLAELSALCADGSMLVFDYPDEGFFAAPVRRVQNTIMMAKAGGEPMRSAFSYGELEALLEKHGFLLYELLTPADIQRDIIDRARTAGGCRRKRRGRQKHGHASFGGRQTAHVSVPLVCRATRPAATNGRKKQSPRRSGRRSCPNATSPAPSVTTQTAGAERSVCAQAVSVTRSMAKQGVSA